MHIARFVRVGILKVASTQRGLHVGKSYIPTTTPPSTAWLKVASTQQGSHVGKSYIPATTPPSTMHAFVLTEQLNIAPSTASLSRDVTTTLHGNTPLGDDVTDVPRMATPP